MAHAHGYLYGSKQVCVWKCLSAAPLPLRVARVNPQCRPIGRSHKPLSSNVRGGNDVFKQCAKYLVDLFDRGLKTRGKQFVYFEERKCLFFGYIIL